MKRKFALLTITPLLLAVAVFTIGGSLVGGGGKKAEAAPFAALNLNVIQQGCLPDGTVEITLNWSSSAEGMQWADLSLADNGFLPGTFVSLGQMFPYQSNLTWDGLLPGRLHFLRVNTLSPYGWMPSDRIAFVTQPCGVSAAINTSAISVLGQQCLPDGTVQVSLTWNPVNGPIAQWVDLSLADNGFAPGTFIGEPAGLVGAFTWSGLIPGRMHFLRVNGFTGIGWQPLPRNAFVTTTC
jgi:hypothetical protein